MEPATFAYRALAKGEIRLLGISRHNGSIVHQLLAFRLIEAPSFAALSYAWDGQRPDKNVLVNGANLKTTKNVRAMLPYLLKHAQSSWFWIDAICINQGDNAEKNVQVPMMCSIYTKAMKAIVWLGEATPQLELAFRSIPQLTPRLMKCSTGFRMLNRELEGCNDPAVNLEALKAAGSIFLLPWFTRVWIFQEAVLPENVEVLCGSHCIGIELLSQFALEMNRTGTGEPNLHNLQEQAACTRGYHTLFSITRQRNLRKAEHRTAEDPEDTQILTRDAINWKASNPSDKVYGLLGLVEKSIREAVTVDYEFAPSMVFVNFAKAHFPSTAHLWLLNRASGCRPIPGLPTWCPNFDDEIRTDGFHNGMAQLGGRRPEFQTGFKANKMAFADHKVACSKLTNELYVPGFRIDTVDKMVLKRGSMQFTEGSLKSLASAAQCTVDFDNRAFTEITRPTLGISSDNEIPEAHWRTLSANKAFDCDGQPYPNNIKPYALVRLFLFYTQYRLKAGGIIGTSKPLGLSAEEVGLVAKYWDDIKLACYQRCFFSTIGGRIGLAPENAKKGDLVCIFYNGYTPFILRPEEGAEKRWRLIGESYVHGLMNGESLEMLERDQDEVFTLI
jgi:hypothetical protein